MNPAVFGWAKVIGAGASAAGAVIAAAPLNKQTAVIAVMAFLAASGSAAGALYNMSPSKPPGDAK